MQNLHRCVCVCKVLDRTLSIFNTDPLVIRWRFCAFMLNNFIHKCRDLILFFCLFVCFYFRWRVNRPSMGSSCDIISPGEHSLLASTFPFTCGWSRLSPGLLALKCLSEGEWLEQPCLKINLPVESANSLCFWWEARTWHPWWDSRWRLLW